MFYNQSFKKHTECTEEAIGWVVVRSGIIFFKQLVRHDGTNVADEDSKKQLPPDQGDKKYDTKYKSETYGQEVAANTIFF